MVREQRTLSGMFTHSGLEEEGKGGRRERGDGEDSGHSFPLSVLE